MDERHEIVRAQLSRRGLLRASGALLGAGPMLLTSSAKAATTPSAAPQQIRSRWLAFGAQPGSQLTVRAQLMGPVPDPHVEFGLDTAYGQKVAAEIQQLRTVLPTGEKLDQYFLVAKLDGLTPGTNYHYRAAHAGSSTPDAAFRTAPAPGQRTPFTFTAFGDQQVGSDSEVVEKVLAQVKPAFHLLAGDISYADDVGHGMATDTFRPKRWSRYFDQIDSIAATTPWMVAVGNHDMEAVYHDHGYGGMVKRFTMPGNGPASCPMTWSMVYGTVAVICLDANEVTSELTANHNYSKGDQTHWLTTELAKHRADPNVDFLVVVMHHCTYSSSSAHGSDLGVRGAWSVLFDQYRVDLVISGHNHNYERTDPIRAGQVPVKAPPGSVVQSGIDGTTYVVCGGGGASLNPFLGPQSASVQQIGDAPVQAQYIQRPGEYRKEMVAWSRLRYKGFSVLAVDVDPGVPGGTATMTLRALDEHNHQFDSVILKRAVSSAALASPTAAASASGQASGTPAASSSGQPTSTVNTVTQDASARGLVELGAAGATVVGVAAGGGYLVSRRRADRFPRAVADPTQVQADTVQLLPSTPGQDPNIDPDAVPPAY